MLKEKTRSKDSMMLCTVILCEQTIYDARFNCLLDRLMLFPLQKLGGKVNKNEVFFRGHHPSFCLFIYYPAIM